MIKTDKSKMLAIGLTLLTAITICSVGCGPSRHYAGKTLPKEQLSTITLQTENVQIHEIDGEKTDLPNPTKSFLFGGGYVGAARALGTAKTRILPGEHTIMVAYRQNCFRGGKGLVTFMAEANHDYRVDCRISESRNNYTQVATSGNQEYITEFTDLFEHDITFVVSDITVESNPVKVGDVTSSIVLEW
jgi:hypothetical protein